MKMLPRRARLLLELLFIRSGAYQLDNFSVSGVKATIGSLCMMKFDCTLISCTFCLFSFFSRYFCFARLFLPCVRCS